MTKSTLQDQEIASLCIRKHCFFNMNYNLSVHFHGFHVLRHYSPELFKFGVENFIEILRNRSMNKPKIGYGDSDKNHMSFGL